MSVQTAFDLGVVWYRDRMKEDWNSSNAQELEATFRQFGLTNGFWRLT